MSHPPASVTVQGGSLEAEHVIAVVGSRRATRPASRFARDLAREAAQRGVVVASGGALGIDAAVHRAALRAGRTWVVAGTGHEHCYPPEHRALFAKVARGPSAMLWPFGPLRHRAFLDRNRILVAISDAVVVVQAGLRSGALHAASCARAIGRPLWVVPASPWMGRYGGSLELLRQGARPLISNAELFSSLVSRPRASMTSATDHSPNESKTLDALSQTPIHMDEIVARCGLGVASVSAALLTLALENVVVEGPQGFFRRHDAR